MGRIPLTIICLLMLLSLPALASADLVVIVNKENANAIDRAMIAKIYLGNQTRWPSGGHIVAIDLPERNPLSDQFVNKVIGKPLRVVKDIWAQSVFTGKAVPPKVVESDEEVKRIVAGGKNAIGYINAASADGSVKVVLTVR